MEGSQAARRLARLELLVDSVPRVLPVPRDMEHAPPVGQEVASVQQGAPALRPVQPEEEGLQVALLQQREEAMGAEQAPSVRGRWALQEQPLPEAQPQQSV